MKPSLLLSGLLWAISMPTAAEDLLAIYQQARQAAPNLATARLQTELSASQQAQAGGALLPQISANVNLLSMTAILIARGQLNMKVSAILSA
jgi:outer membrane protein TolC